MPRPLEDASLFAKTTILQRTIKEDQTAVAYQWLNTFRHNPLNDAATNIAKLLFACISCGDFKTRSSLHDNTLQNPPNTLTTADYLSHASRVIIDYSELNEENKAGFLSFFPKAGERNVVSRSATHAVVRKKGQLIELKGFILGLSGQLPTLLKTPYDFGVNIAMGGEGQVNLVGKKISSNGYSGHLYFHHYTPEQLILLGLEQSAPATSLFEVLWGSHNKEDQDVQNEHDQFGQGHSLVGASDTYTAAGSLYFSDPLYQAKLLTEMNSIPPDKYNGMQVTLSDASWEPIKSLLVTMDSHVNTGRFDLLFELLNSSPKTAQASLPPVKSYIALDFKAYLKRITIFLDQLPENDSLVIERHKALQNELILVIAALQAGRVTEYAKFQKIVQTICKTKGTPPGYIVAIERIQTLFELQSKIDPELKETHLNILLQQRCTEVLDDIIPLQERAKIIREYFSSEHISKENGVGAYLTQLELALQKLDTIKYTLMFEPQPVAAIEEDTQQLTSLSSSTSSQSSLPSSSSSVNFNRQSLLEISWLEVSPVSLEEVSTFQEYTQSLEQLLLDTPRLVSEAFFLKEKSARHLLAIENQHLQTTTNQQEQTIRSLQEELLAKEFLCLQIKSLSNREKEFESALAGKTVQLTTIEATIAPIRSREQQLARINDELLIELGLARKENEKLSEANAQLESKVSNLRSELALRIESEKGAKTTKEAITHARKALIDIAPLYTQIKNLEEQSLLLKNRGHQEAHKVANELCLNLRKEIDNYLTKKSEGSTSHLALKQFKDNCLELINDKANAELLSHRGWKRLLANLAACIVGLGVGYLITGICKYYSQGEFLLFNKTRSAEKLGEIKSSLTLYANEETERLNSSLIVV